MIDVRFVAKFLNIFWVWSVHCVQEVRGCATWTPLSFQLYTVHKEWCSYFCCNNWCNICCVQCAYRIIVSLILFLLHSHGLCLTNSPHTHAREWKPFSVRNYWMFTIYFHSISFNWLNALCFWWMPCYCYSTKSLRKQIKQITYYLSILNTLSRIQGRWFYSAWVEARDKTHNIHLIVLAKLLMNPKRINRSN